MGSLGVEKKHGRLRRLVLMHEQLAVRKGHGCFVTHNHSVENLMTSGHLTVSSIICNGFGS